ncbi:hypothetical protein ASPZODRAFT_127230 [Penicilliopsis zonata CBS 506.65]|uniref:Uncharacterized protein n=1 Tax=Penicilliopsis zonata CBS 506.65 TaxID=1073090 RepID=A0A1L9SVL1_9EURO|nr:hypothetical protein ASPZODRAFT_127230 [Penicilliopsis zonata CBS 506.65]OJJ51206.1 hypothetical protein ASPZODRAFT_127230 [Penicilliopsis zonata CBS 506.65]
MRATNILLVALPAAVQAADATPAPAPVDLAAHVPTITPFASLLDIQGAGDNTRENIIEIRQVAGDDAAAAVAATTSSTTTIPDQWASPSTGSIGLGSLTGTVGATETVTVSEGTLGQTPWVGMAIGLTFTALAAVMLG